MKPGIYEIDPPGSDNLLWVNEEGRVHNGEYDLERIDEHTARLHPKYQRGDWTARYLGGAPRGRGYNDVIEKFRQSRKEFCQYTPGVRVCDHACDCVGECKRGLE
jgi:hypothetical protein